MARKYTLILYNENTAISKGINYIENISNIEIEITEEQYNQITEFPLKLTFNTDGKVISWEKVVIEYEPIPEQPKEPTEEDYLIDLDFRVSMIELGLEV